jgi:hypothetical protein
MATDTVRCASVAGTEGNVTTTPEVWGGTAGGADGGAGAGAGDGVGAGEGAGTGDGVGEGAGVGDGEGDVDGDGDGDGPTATLDGAEGATGLPLHEVNAQPSVTAEDVLQMVRQNSRRQIACTAAERTVRT